MQQGIRSSSLAGRVRVAGSRFPRGSSPRGDAIRDLYGLPLHTDPPPLLWPPPPSTHLLKPCTGCPVAPRVGARYKFRGWKSRVIYIHTRECANCICAAIYIALHIVLYSPSSLTPSARRTREGEMDQTKGERVGRHAREYLDCAFRLWLRSWRV